MSTYNELFEDGERARMAHQPLAAFGPYKAALGMGGDKDRTIRHMMGVCHKMLGEYPEAIALYQEALPGASPFERGNILRDMAGAYTELGEHTGALVFLNEAMLKLPYTIHPAHFGITLGFFARTEVRMNRWESAIKHFKLADLILHGEYHSEFELYNKLPYANALSVNGQWFMARVQAVKAYVMAYDHGARHHRIRALALFIGGHKLDDYVQNRWPPK